MRISDWSSDVCSSYLHADPADGPIGNGGDKTQACGGDDTDRPFRADQQLLYVIAAVVFLERIQAMMNTAVWQHRLNPFDKRSHGAMTQHRSEEHPSELQSLMRISYAVFCLKKKH